MKFISRLLFVQALVIVNLLFISACAPNAPRNIFTVYGPTAYPSDSGSYDLIVTPVTVEEASNPELYGTGLNVVYYIVNDIGSLEENRLSIVVVQFDQYDPSSLGAQGYAIGTTPLYFKVAGDPNDILSLMKKLCQETAVAKGVIEPECP